MRRASTCLAVLVALFMPALALAQSSTSATIFGVVKDSTGGTLPGVTVTVTGPALQVPQVEVVSEADGSYRVSDLPAGTYNISYTLSGFTTVVRSEVRITTGFQARLDVSMSVGSVQETITVSGESPIVDVASTSTGATITRELVDNVPRTKEFGALLTMTPGATASGAPDVGGSQLTGRYQVDSFGIAQQPKLSVEGINITTGSGNNSADVFSSYNFDEVKVSTSGADAETSTPGISIVAVLKSGSNELHGSVDTHFQDPRLQSDNLTQAVKDQGVTAGNALDHFYGISGDLGGRIVRDKLWYYVGFNRQTRVEEQLGFVDGPGPDGQYLTGDEPAGLVHTTLAGATYKVSYQPSRKVKLIGVYQKGTKIIPEFNAGRFTPRESLDNYLDPTWVWKYETQATLSNQLLINANGGWGGYIADHNCVRGAELFYGKDNLKNLVSRTYEETGLETGPCTGVDYRPRSRYQLDSSVTYFPTKTMAGRHEFKVGESIYWENTFTRERQLPWGSLNHVYDIVNGVSNQPFSITLYNSPTEPRNRLDTYAFYAKDGWRITDKFTANLGLRYEYQHAYLPEQEYPGSPEWPSVFPAKSFDYIDVLTWKKLMPRVGLAYQLFPKSVLKGTWGIYADTAGDDFAQTYNGNSGATASFRWHDNNGNNRWDPGESNFDLNGTDFLTISAAANNIINPDLKQPTTREMSVAWEQELTRTMAVRLQYVDKQYRDQYASVNVLRPYDAYSNAITRVDPGPDGIAGNSDDGGPVTLYDYRTEFRGARFVGNKRVNGTTPDNYYAIETGVSKRMASGWSASFSYFATKRDVYINPVVSNPNQDLFNKDETWSWGSSVTAIAQLPKRFMLSTFIQAKSGARGERSYTFRSIPNSSTLTVRLGERGSFNNPSFTTVNMKVQRKFAIGRGNLDFAFDVFNIFNSATATGITKTSGPTYGFITGILAPRVAQVGLRYGF